MPQLQLSGDGQGVSFSQEDIQFETGSVDDSDSAGLNINLSQLSTASGIGSGGYLNVVNADGWAVENLEVNSNTSTYLDLAAVDGTDETAAGTNQAVFYSPTPLNTQPLGTATHFSLTADNISPGGMIDDPGAATFIAPAAFTGPTPTGANNLKIQAGHPNIDAAVNQCAPAAAANGITYLQSAFNFVTAGASNVEGRGQVTGGTYPNNGTVKIATFDGNGGEQDALEPGDSMVGEMDLAMARSSQDRKTLKQVGAQINNPTPFLNQLSGIQKFLSITGGDAGKVKVNYEDAGSGVNNVFSGAGTVAGIPANAINGGKIDATSPAYILAEIAAGSMVNLDYAVMKPPRQRQLRGPIRPRGRYHRHRHHQRRAANPHVIRSGADQLRSERQRPGQRRRPILGVDERRQLPEQPVPLSEQLARRG